MASSAPPLPLLLLLLLLLLCSPSSPTPLVGVLQLDSFSFNKTLSAFPFSLVKFDKGYPTGDGHKMWGELARELAAVEEVAVAEVRLKDYGDKANQDLALRFNLQQEQLPEVILFKRNGRTFEEIRYGAPLQKDEVLTFLKHKTPVYLALPGCLKRYDSLARWFLRAVDADDRAEVAKVIARTRQDVDAEADDAARASGNKYLKVMQMVELKGEAALRRERARVAGLLADADTTMSAAKSDELRATLNVLTSFERLQDPRERREDEKREEEEEGKKDEL